MPQAIPYLSFNGDCADAMRFYETVLDAKIAMMMTGADSPMADQFPPETAQRVMHARLIMDDGTELYAGDCMQPYVGMQGVTLTLNYATVARAQQVFAALAEGGVVQMPMQPQFWARSWGMLTDRFGIVWMVNGELLEL